jgi:hypothetical protein
MERFKWSRKAESVGELARESPVAVGTTSYQGRNLLSGDILNQPSRIFFGLLVEAGEQQRDTTASINAEGFIGNTRFAEKGLEGIAELLKEEDGTSEKETDHDMRLRDNPDTILTL